MQHKLLAYGRFYGLQCNESGQQLSGPRRKLPSWWSQSSRETECWCQFSYSISGCCSCFRRNCCCSCQSTCTAGTAGCSSSLAASASPPAGWSTTGVPIPPTVCSCPIDIDSIRRGEAGAEVTATAHAYIHARFVSRDANFAPRHLVVTIRQRTLPPQRNIEEFLPSCHVYYSPLGVVKMSATRIYRATTRQSPSHWRRRPNI